MKKRESYSKIKQKKRRLESEKILKSLELMWKDISDQIFCLQKALANHRKDSTEKSNARRIVR